MLRVWLPHQTTRRSGTAYYMMPAQLLLLLSVMQREHFWTGVDCFWGGLKVHRWMA